MTARSPTSFEESIPAGKVSKLLQLLSPTALSKLSTKLFGEESALEEFEQGSPSSKEERKVNLASKIVKHIVRNEIVETPKRKGVKDALFGKGEYKVVRYKNWHNHYTSSKGDQILAKIKKQIQDFAADPDVTGFHIGKATADSATDAISNRWNTTYSKGYSGMIVIYEDTEINSSLAAARWEGQQKRQIKYEKRLHREFCKHEKWIPQSTERPGSITFAAKKTFCLYVAYKSESMGVINWSPASDAPTTRHDKNVAMPSLSHLSRPLPTSPTRFAPPPPPPKPAQLAIPVRSNIVQHVPPVNKELSYGTPSRNVTVVDSSDSESSASDSDSSESESEQASAAGPRGLVGYEGSITDLKTRFDKDDVKRCKLKVLSGELNGQTVVVTRFNGTSTYVQTSRGDDKTLSSSNRVKVVSFR